MSSTRDMFLRAAKEHNVEVVTFFVEKSDLLGDDFVNEANSDGWTALYYAVKDKHVQLLDVLLTANNIDVNVKTTAGTSLLLLAIVNEDFEIIDKLLAVKDIDVNMKNKFGNTALHVAARRRGCQGIVEKLLSVSNIDVTIKNCNNKTALDVAADIESRSLISSFIAARPNSVACPSCGYALTIK